jgi:NADH dehydrogenase (ubiquinone) 1 alpha subcomplex subunit 5
MNIISAVEPEGYKAWAEKARKTLEEHPEVFTTPEGGVDHDGARHERIDVGGKVFVGSRIEKEYDELNVEWDGEKDEGPELEGTRTKAERKGQIVWGLQRPGTDTKTVEWEAEPPLSAEQ